METGREIGFTSSNLPLARSHFSEDTESQYADELRRQAYIQTLGRLLFILYIYDASKYPYLYIHAKQIGCVQ